MKGYSPYVQPICSRTAKRCTNLLEYFCTWRIIKEEMDFSSPSSSSDRMSKNQMMNEVRNQVAMATAQELIQVIYCIFNAASIYHVFSPLIRAVGSIRLLVCCSSVLLCY